MFRICDPVDLFILMLGTNDTKDFFSASAATIANGMDQLVQELLMLLPNSLSAQAKLLVVSPIHITPSANGSYFYDCCTFAAEKKTRALAPLYRQLAERHRCFF